MNRKLDLGSFITSKNIFIQMHAINLLQRVCDSRGQLCVVDQVLQWVAATELVQQAGQVTDDGRWIRCVDVP